MPRYQFAAKFGLLSIEQEGEWPNETWRAYCDGQPLDYCDRDPQTVAAALWAGNISPPFSREEDVADIPFSLDEWRRTP